MAAAATGVVVTLPDSSTRTYGEGRSITFDGYGDLQVLDEAGKVIATRKRGTWDEIEVVYA